MAVVQGTVEVKVNVNGAGNAAAVVDKTTEAIKRTEKASEGVGKSLLGMRERMAQVVGIVDSGAGQMLGQFGAVGDLVTNVSSKFGVWGAVIGGVIAAGVGLFEIFSGGEPKLTAFGEAMAQSAKNAGDMAGAMTVIAANARDATKALDGLGKATVEAYAKTAEARGDQAGAAKIRQGQASRELDVTAAQAQNDVTGIIGLLAGARAGQQAAQADIADTSNKLREALNAGDQSAVAVLSVRLTQGRIALKEAENATEDLSTRLWVAKKYMAGIKAEADEVALQANRIEGVSFYTPDSPTTFKGPGGGGGAGAAGQSAEAIAARERQAQMKAAQDRLATDALIRGLADRADKRDEAAGAQNAKEEEERQRAERLKKVEEIGAIGRAFTDAIPGMEKFAATLDSIQSIWVKWSETGKDTKGAIVGSLGAIAIAGANEIKNQRTRAGVLAVIETGLGFANIENPMVAAAHFTAAAVLGGVAIFGGSSGGKGGSAGTQARAPRAVRSDNVGSGAIVININGSYYGAATPQESGAAFARLISRADGTGFGARG